MIMRRHIFTPRHNALSHLGIVILALMLTTQVSAQEINRVITGRVFDSATKQPAAGVHIEAYNDARYAAMTDENGVYTIKVPDFVTSISAFADGYVMVQQSVANGKEQADDIYMYSDNFKENYSRSTTAQSKASALVDYFNNDMSIDNQIESKLNGDILAINRNGVPGEGVKMLLQGINSLNANAQPLVIVDGLILDMQYNNPSIHDGFFNNMLSNIMVEDIEKVTVLKNGTAIYGAKGANGVVLIDTKRNKSMATKIDLSIGGSFELLPKLPDMMNSEQYRVYASEMIGTTGTKTNQFKFLQTSPNYYYYNVYHNNTDWTDYVYDEAFTQNYSMNVQGGDDVANYNLSVGYASSNATQKYNEFSRFNLRLNSDITVLRNLTVRFDASYSDVNRNMRDDGIKNNVMDGIISSPGFLSLIKSPFLSPYAYDTNGRLSHYLADADDFLSDVLPARSYRASLANPLAILENGEADNKNDFGNRVVNLAVTPKLILNRYWSISEHFGFSIDNTDENYYLPTDGVPTFDVEHTGTVENKAASLAARQISISSNTYANFNKRFGANRVNVLGGLLYSNNSYNLNTQGGYNTGNDKTPNMSADLEYPYTDGTEDKDIDMIYYLQGDYSFSEKYFASASLSLNGSSRFGVDASDGMKIGNYAWGFFYSAEAAWLMSSEKWFNVKGIDYLKLNVGFDHVGNDDIDSKSSRTYFVSHRLLDSTTGKVMENIGNTSLQWETTNRFTAGINLSALHNRLFVGFNFFTSKTSNLLSLNTLSYLTGLYTNWSNGGSLKNTGFDASLRGRIINTGDWKWELGATMGHYKNEITALPGNRNSYTTDLYGATILTKEGLAAGTFYGYKTNGVFATTSEAEAAGIFQLTTTGQQQYFSAGDMKFVDQNGDKCISEADMTVIGDPNPDFYGNITSSLSYKRLRLDLVFNYSVGGDIYNYQRSLLEGGSYFYNQTTAMLHRWQYEGQQTDIPRASYLDTMGNSRFSDRWIEDGSYLKLKNVTLSYNIPVRSTYLQAITLWGSANNLFTITKYLGSDPEFSMTNSVLGMGIDRGLHAPGRSFSLGVKINL